MYYVVIVSLGLHSVGRYKPQRGGLRRLEAPVAALCVSQRIKETKTASSPLQELDIDEL